jgi:hypothetical protein
MRPTAALRLPRDYGVRPLSSCPTSVFSVLSVVEKLIIMHQGITMKNAEDARVEVARVQSL